MYWCYVIYSSARRQYYIGVTDDVTRRVQDHNNGISKWTKGKGPWQLEWSREFMSLGDARKIENILADEIAAGHTVELRNSGILGVVSHRSRKGRNPNHPEKKEIIPSRAGLRLNYGKALKARVLQSDAVER